ncbi:MAG: hypothetical protein KGZ35_08450 [Truepera sp.]|nr:hypothetical protein [Truepera sp.]
MLEELTGAVQLLQRDPVLGYSLLASLLLAAVSLSSGLARLDFVVLAKASVLLRMAFLVGLAAALRHLGETADNLLWQGAITGAWHLPLYLLALGYGPSVGLAAAGLMAVIAVPSGWGEALLAHQLLILGWLAIYPSPRHYRWAGPLNVALAYGLTWITGGVAMTYVTTGAVQLSFFWTGQQVELIGLALAMAALLLFGPNFYQSFFAASRLTPPAAPQTRPRQPTLIAIPPPLTRRRTPKRQLTPPRFDE